MAATNKDLARSNKSDRGARPTNKRRSKMNRRWVEMTYITSEDLADLDETIDDEMEVEEFAMAAAREASAMLLDLLTTHHGDRAPRS